MVGPTNFQPRFFKSFDRAIDSGEVDAAWPTAGLVGWMALWWMTEALPLYATAFLPFVVLPLYGVIRRIENRVGSGAAYMTFDIDCLDPSAAPGTGRAWSASSSRCRPSPRARCRSCSSRRRR